MDVRMIVGLLLPFLKEVIFGKPVDEGSKAKQKWHAKVISFFMGSRRATALLIVCFTIAVVIDVVAIQKLASIALGREKEGQVVTEQGEVKTGETKDLIVKPKPAFKNDLDHDQAKALVLRHLAN